MNREVNMSYLNLDTVKPSKPIKRGDVYVFPVTTVDQIIVDENTDARLPSIIKTTATISSSGWISQSNGTYTQTVTIQGVSGGSDIIVSPTVDYIEAYINAGCEPITQGTNTITFSCTSPPSINISIELIIYNFT